MKEDIGEHVSARNHVEVLGKEVVYDGYFRLDRYRLRHRQFAGGFGPVVTRELLERGRVAAVLPVDPFATASCSSSSFDPVPGPRARIRGSSNAWPE